MSAYQDIIVRRLGVQAITVLSLILLGIVALFFELSVWRLKVQ